MPRESGAEKMPSRPLGMALKLIRQGVMMLAAALVAWAFRAKSDNHNNGRHLLEPPSISAEYQAAIDRSHLQPFDQVEEAENERVLS